MRSPRWILTLCFSIASLFAEAPSYPAEFTVTEQFLAILPTFDISSQDGSFASATSRFFSITAAYDLSDSLDNFLARGRARFFAWGTVADLYDSDDLLIGTLEEQVIRIFPWAEYHLYDAEHRPLAHVLMNFFGTQFEVRHPQDPTRIYATIQRPFIRFFRDIWTVRILDPYCGIDPRILIFVAVFQTDKDNRDRHRKDIQGELIREQEDFEGRRFD